jgi:hypothetical protein
MQQLLPGDTDEPKHEFQVKIGQLYDGVKATCIK